MCCYEGDVDLISNILLIWHKVRGAYEDNLTTLIVDAQNSGTPKKALALCLSQNTPKVHIELDLVLYKELLQTSPKEYGSPAGRSASRKRSGVWTTLIKRWLNEFSTYICQINYKLCNFKQTVNNQTETESCQFRRLISSKQTKSHVCTVPKI